MQRLFLYTNLEVDTQPITTGQFLHYLPYLRFLKNCYMLDLKSSSVEIMKLPILNTSLDFVKVTQRIWLLPVSIACCKEIMMMVDLSCCICLDLSKAFDTVNHDILLNKLEKYGIRSNMHQLLCSHLNNRKQYTECNSVKSDLKTVLCGVPQGSTFYFLYT